MMDTMENGEVKMVLLIYFDVPERVDISSRGKVTFVATCIVLFQIHDQSFSQRVFQRSKKPLCSTIGQVGVVRYARRI